MTAIRQVDFLTGLGNTFVEIESGLTDDDVRLRFNQEMCHSYNDIEGPGQKGDFSDFFLHETYTSAQTNY